MAKGKPGKAKVAKTWASKTKTPKNRRSGIRAALHHSLPVIRLQTPVPERAPYNGLTSMRLAFMLSEIPDGAEDSVFVNRIVRSLERGFGSFKSSGWTVINRRGRNGKRRS